ncbi:hypothetical protein F5887DRAFT_1069453 [Amanita rubescens]|nr:hypothetical protein F5887DRAFT_1069453 [Amanita rubescens]
MDPNFLSLLAQSGNAPRHLPAYEETNIPYSFRLPTYRSSYVRRFHPYARYVTVPIDEDDMDEGDFGVDQTLLDLGILGQSALLHHAAPAAPANECVD